MKQIKTKSIILSLLLVIGLAVGIVPITGIIPTTAQTSVYDGTPVTPTKITSSNYAGFGLTSSNWSSYNGWYGIRTAAEMYGFAQLVNSGDRKANAVLLNDVALNAGTVTANGSSSGTTYSWTPIGKNSAFLGNFDGNGCTVSGLYINGSDDYVGLFGYVGEAARTYVNISNIVLANSYIHGNKNVAGIAARVNGNYTTISNCKISEDVSIVASMYYLGGIVGSIGSLTAYIDPRSKATNCVVLGSLSSEYEFFPSEKATYAKPMYLHIGTITGEYQLSSENSAAYFVMSNCYYKKDCLATKWYTWSWKSNDAYSDGREWYTVQKTDTYNYGAGGAVEGKYYSNSGCTMLESASASHTCVTVTHKEIKATCKYPGCSEYTYCLICGKVTNGTKTVYAVDSNAHPLSNEVTCISGATCLTCGKTYAKNPNNHASEEFTYTYIDANKHENRHACCDAFVTKEDHTFLSSAKNSCKHCGSFVSKPVEVTKNNYKSLGLTQNYVGYYAISTVPELYWFAGLTNGTLTDGTKQNPSANAVLLNDITVNRNVIMNIALGTSTDNFAVWEPIGNYKKNGEKNFIGTFDGNGYTVSGLYADSDTRTFGFIASTSTGACVKNLTVADSYFKDTQANVAGIVGFNEGTIEKCATIDCIFIGDRNVGGIAGVNNSGNIQNCYSTSAVSGNSYVGGIVGFVQNNGAVRYCYFAGANTCKAWSTAIAYAYGKNTVIENCYCDENSQYMDVYLSSGGKVTNVVSKNTDQFKSGETAYLLNGKSSSGVWKQNLGSDSYPSFNGGTVYLVPTDCGGKNGTRYSNTKPEDISHVYDKDGLCRNTDNEIHYEPAVLNNGVYEISNAGQLRWFADKVNGGDTAVKGKLMNDIDATVLDDLGIGSGDKPYAGVFDGCKHKIKLKLNKNTQYLALFPYVNNATIKNLTVEGDIAASNKYAASIIGNAGGDAVLLENCLSYVTIESVVNGDGTHGGLVGVVSGTLTINNCGFAGSVNGSQTTSCGGLVGWVSGKCTIKNSFVVPVSYTVSTSGGNTFARNAKYLQLQNCYYLKALGETPSSGAQQKSSEYFKNGEVAYLLNNKSSSGVWKQNINEDSVPNFIGSTVYLVPSDCGGETGTTYSNTKPDAVSHIYDKNGICHGSENELHYEPAVFENGVYKISNAGQLYWFSCLVNGTLKDIAQDQSANAVLTNDIDMSVIENWTSIGGTTGLYYSKEDSDKGYKGTFDGNGHVIKNLNIKGSDSKELTYGVFGTLSGTVKHLGVENLTFTLGTQDCRAGGIAGQMLQGSKISDCYVVNSDIKAPKKVAGGIAGCNYGGTIENCYTYAVSVEANRAGGIVGDNCDDNNGARKGTIINCYTDASTIENSERKGNVNNCAAGVSKNAFASGEIAYKLNKGNTDGTQIWYQTLYGSTTNDLPEFNGETVYFKKDAYTNIFKVTINGVQAENSEYNGLSHSGYTGTLTNEDGYTGIYEIFYTGRNGTVYSSAEAPVNAGDYTVTVKTDSTALMWEGKASFDFTITKKQITVVLGEQKITKGDALSKDAISVSELADGDTLTVTAVIKGDNCTYTATVIITNGVGADVTANYAFSNSGIYHEHDWDTQTHEYKCINCGSVENTDVTLPTAQYKIGENEFKKFINTITFGLFCKDYQTVTIEFDDDNSGVKFAQYYISNKVLSREELDTVLWSTYETARTLDARATYIIYVKVTDNAGNVGVYNSEGIVIFADSTADVQIEYTRTDGENVTAEIDFGSNTVKEVKLGDSVLILGKDYTVEDDGICFTSEFLESLAAQSTAYIITVSYNAGGVAWGENSYGTEPTETVIAVTVKKAQGRVSDVSDISKIYDGKEVSNVAYSILGNGNVTVEYKVFGEEDSTYTTVAPKNAGKYIVRVTAAADDDYTEASATAKFTISQKNITVKIDAKTSVYGDDIAILTSTDKGITDNDFDVYVLSTQASKTAGVGKYDIVGTVLNDNYNITFENGTEAYEITARELTITVVVANKKYDGLNKASISKAELNNVANGDNIKLVNGIATFVSINPANDINIRFTEFALSADDSVLKNYTLKQPIGVTASIIKDWSPIENAEYTTSVPNKNGWLKDDFVVTAKGGYVLSDTDKADGKWTKTLVGSEEGTNRTLEFYVKNTKTGEISEKIILTYSLDKNIGKNATVGKVYFDERHSWETFVNKITFGLFFKNEMTVKAEAFDRLSDVESIEYVISDKALKLDEVKALTSWTVMPKDGVGIEVKDTKMFVCYVRITDKAGNKTYLSTDGAEYDITSPAIEGVENGAVYYTTKYVKVTDKNLESVTVNGQTIQLDESGSFAIAGNVNAIYTIKVTDKAGNATEYTVTMKTIADITEDVNDIKTDNVTSADKEKLEQIIENIESELKNNDISDDEKQKLNEQKQNIQDIIDRIDEAAKATDTENTNKVKDITCDNVKKENKSDLKNALNDLNKALEDYAGNLTDSEKNSIKDEIKRIEDALAVIDRVENAENIINKLPTDIKEENFDDVEAADDAYNALTDYEKSILDEAAKNKLKDAKAALEELNKPNNNGLWIWIVLIVLICGALLAVIICKKNKKSEKK